MNKVVRMLCLTVVVAGIQVAQGQTFTILHTFASTDGANPQGALVQDAAGNLYGTTFDRGTYGYGTLFKMDSTGTVTVLYSFAGPPDGANPSGALVLDSSGNLYGTTEWGGSANLGTVFKMSTTGDEAILHDFAGGSDGANPEGGVILDSAGALYGTTSGGGTGAGCETFACGIVFKVDAGGNESVLYTFNGDTASGVDGANPWGALVRDAGGNLYGTTVYGGSKGLGTIFKLDTAGHETLLHQFTGKDGSYPYSTLVRDAAGNLYGTAYEGGTSKVGTMFELSPKRKLTVLHNFSGNADGAYPAAGVVAGKTGIFYGTTSQGGPADFGTVYEMQVSGKETVVHAFTGGRNGLIPETGLLLDATGNVYGTTYYGGAKNSSYGTVFKMMP